MSNTKRLRGLLAGAKADQGLTLDKLVERFEGTLGRSAIGDLLNEEVRARPLTAVELHAIARAFDLPYGEVLTAHLADMDLLPEGTRDAPAIVLPPEAERLSPTQRAAVVSVVRAMLEPRAPDDLAAHRIRHEMRTRLEDGARQSAAPEGEEDAATPAPRQRRGRR